MDIHYLCGELGLQYQIEARRADALPSRFGTPSPIVAMIGRSARAASRAMSRIALWADGSTDVPFGIPGRATVR